MQNLISKRSFVDEEEDVQKPLNVTDLTSFQLEESKEEEINIGSDLNTSKDKRVNVSRLIDYVCMHKKNLGKFLVVSFVFIFLWMLAIILNVYFYTECTTSKTELKNSVRNMFIYSLCLLIFFLITKSSALIFLLFFNRRIKKVARFFSQRNILDKYVTEKFFHECQSMGYQLRLLTLLYEHLKHLKDKRISFSEEEMQNFHKRAELAYYEVSSNVLPFFSQSCYALSQDKNNKYPVIFVKYLNVISVFSLLVLLGVFLEALAAFGSDFLQGCFSYFTFLSILMVFLIVYASVIYVSKIFYLFKK